jgi:antitoxin YefM
MTVVTSYTEARAHLSALMDKVLEDREPVVIHRRGSSNVVLIAEEELQGLEETAHLLRSPANARRLLEGLQQAAEGQGRTMAPEELRAEVGLGPRRSRKR